MKSPFFGVWLSSCCLFILTTFGEQVHAQSNYTGTVRDAVSQEVLVFVSIQRLSTEDGTYTNLDGDFLLAANAGDTLRVRYLGYEEKRVVLGKALEVAIFLENTSVGLAEIVVRPKENPAWRIIRTALINRDQHDPLQKAGFQYQAYHKTVLNVDTIRTPAESTRLKRPRKPRSAARDAARQRSNELRARRQSLFLNEMHLWVTETRSQHAFRTPHQHKEIVLATQSSVPNDMTGGVNPINFQPFGFYQEVIRMEMTDQNYVNPLSEGTFQHYDFHLADTIVHGIDTTYIIEFEPLPGKYFTALQGVLFINTDGYAIERVIAESADPAQTLQFVLQQENERVNGAWFPKALQADIFFEAGTGDVSVKYGFRNRSILAAIDLRPPPARFFNHYLKENQSVGQELTDSMRLLPLSERELNTYTYWDSLPELRPAYRLLSFYGPFAQAMSSGLITGKRIDLVLPDLLNFNAREGTRLGLGFKTSPNVWSGGSLYGYAGYGLQDRQWKYGGALELNLYPERDLKLRLGYQQDLVAPGGVNYLSSVNNPWSNWNARNLILERFDEQERWRADLVYRPHGSWQVNIFGQRESRALLYDYAFGESPTMQGARYEVEQVGTRLRWAPRERLVKMGQLETILYPVFPVIDLTVARLGSPGFSAQRITARLDHEWRWKYLGITEINLQAGWLSEALPYPYLFQAPGNGDNAVSGGNLFNTAGTTEFAQEKFAYLFFSHNFGTLLGRIKSPRFRPELRVMQQIGWGQLSAPSQHHGIDIKDMHKGFLESGVGLDNVLRISYFKALYFGLGASVWYRWGAYHLPVFEDNIRVQMTLNISV